MLWVRHSRSRSPAFPHSLAHDLSGRPQTMIKRFLKQRDTAQVRVREVGVSPRLPCLLTNAAPNKIRAWADHRVPPTHDVETFAKFVDVGMRTRDIGKTHIGELLPV